MLGRTVGGDLLRYLDMAIFCLQTSIRDSLRHRGASKGKVHTVLHSDLDFARVTSGDGATIQISTDGDVLKSAGVVVDSVTQDLP
jgi:hypothetical protein